MIFTHITPEKLDWPHIAGILAPAVMPDPNETMEGLHGKLMSGRDLLMTAEGEDEGFVAIVLEITPDAACWIKYMAGTIFGGPKNRIRLAREGVAWIEQAARNAGCKELCICGRDWSRTLTDFLVISDAPEPNLLRKTLVKEAA